MGPPRKRPQIPPEDRNPNWQPSKELQAKVHYLAWRWSMGRIEDLDDLYQEGLLAIWLKGETQAPLNHQLRTAQERMIDVRKLGRSVDGRMNPSSARARPWLVLSMDRMTYGVAHRGKLVEDYVVDRLTVLEILSLLTLPEQQFLGLVYQGFTQPEVARLTGQSVRRLHRIMKAIREKVCAYLHGEESLVGAQESDQRHYPDTLAAATASGEPWTEEEDRIVLERAGDPAHEVALDLGRTLWAVRHRRSRLRKRG